MSYFRLTYLCSYYTDFRSLVAWLGCLPACLPPAYLPVCLATYVKPVPNLSSCRHSYLHVYLSDPYLPPVQLHTRLQPPISACLPAWLPACLPACLSHTQLVHVSIPVVLTVSYLLHTPVVCTTWPDAGTDMLQVNWPLEHAHIITARSVRVCVCECVCMCVRAPPYRVRREANISNNYYNCATLHRKR